MKKRICLIISSYTILILIVSLLINVFGQKNNINEDKLKIIVTLYPEYDIVSHICGENVDIDVLIGAGVEAHTYEPSVKDMKNITDSDMFIYTCNSMEPWAQTIINSIDSDCKIVDASKNITLVNLDEFMDKYSILDNVEEKNTEHDYEYDGHIWMNPKNYSIMIDTICENIVNLDPSNKEYYEKNSRNYKDEILSLDKEIEETLKEKNINTMVFGGEFAYAYFCERYNLNIISAYSACGEGTEPSVSRIKEIIDYININKIDKVFYEELSEGTVAKMISEETSVKSLVFNTLHNVSNEEISNGENYVTIMRKNLKKICN